MTTPALMIATHSYGTVLPQYARSLAVLGSHLSMWGVPHQFAMVRDCLVGRGRDRAAAHFRASACTHLLFIDGDIEFPPEAVARLLRAKKPLVAASYAMKDESGRFAFCLDPAQAKGAQVDADSGVVEVAGVGTGFMLIERQVFDAIEAAGLAPAWSHEDGQGGSMAMRGFFEEVIEDGARVSEDYTFCRRYRRAGGRVWLCPEIKLRHWGERVWEAAPIEALRLIQRPEPAAA